jgi:single-strand DNA-binding protein
MLEQYKATGSIYKIYPLKNHGERFRTREFVLLIPDGSYQQFVKFQLRNLKCDLLEHFQEEDEVTVHFNLEGRPFIKNGIEEIYSHLSVWQIEIARPYKAAIPGLNDKIDDLPF